MTAFKTQIQQEEAKVVNKRDEELQAQQKAMAAANAAQAAAKAATQSAIDADRAKSPPSIIPQASERVVQTYPDYSMRTAHRFWNGGDEDNAKHDVFYAKCYQTSVGYLCNDRDGQADQGNCFDIRRYAILREGQKVDVICYGFSQSELPR